MPNKIFPTHLKVAAQILFCNELFTDNLYAVQLMLKFVVEKYLRVTEIFVNLVAFIPPFTVDLLNQHKLF